MEKEEKEQTTNGNVSSAENNLHDNLLDNKKHDEDVLDFEAEEGECNDGVKEDKLLESKVI